MLKIKVNGNEYDFLNNERGNRSGFVHETKLYKNCFLIGQYKIQYYNRTYERYEYERVMKSCVNQLMEEIKKDWETNCKESHGIKRLTQQKREEMQKDFAECMPENYRELQQLYNTL